ncbi:MAG TPA: hydroxymethylglutaryl-CoA lyase [Bacteroidetes bacterium]|nr:hydroxymethylglutaryl-CoA lyase [Bacteroidota bacterium]
MQGIHDFIPTAQKIRYIQQLLKVGFDTLDAGSFVSPKAIPQMKDTAEVLRNLDLSATKTRLLCIVANNKGADDAISFDEVSYLGFPFSVSETFQIRNTNSTIEEAVTRVDYIQNLCLKHNKQLVVYLSMGFGNPYGDPWSPEIVSFWMDHMVKKGIRIISLSDTIGVSNPENIRLIYSQLSKDHPNTEIGAHLHTRAESWREKIQAAYDSGCTRYDGAIKGYGGCPMAADTLTGNMPTENLLRFLKDNQESPGVDEEQFNVAMQMANEVFL